MTSALQRVLVIGSAFLGWLGSAARAEVVRMDIESRTPLAGQFGEAGAYELLKGRYYGELDPRDRKNAIITDLALAPRNARGWVEYSATFALAKPVDMAKASGVLFYDVPNRGRGAALGDADGHIHVISGWQGDIPPAGGMQTATVPVARNPDGSPITGPVLVRIVDAPEGARSVPLTVGIAGGVPAAAPLTLDSANARLTGRRSDREPGAVVPSTDWSFGDCTLAAFPGKPDPRLLCLKNGFQAGVAYELTYTAKDPPVLGIGFAAVRDLNAFLRYSPGSAAAPNPIAGKVRWAVVTGVSQSGNFVRSFIHLGFNQAPNGRIVFDGANPHIAARQVPLNVRFGVPGGAANLYEPGSDGVLWWGEHDDVARGRGRTSLLARCERTRTCPKIVETFGSAEVWGLRMSPNLVGLEAKADIPLPANVRRYYFPSVTHGGGAGGFSTAGHGGATGCTLAGNPNPSEPSRRALIKALVDWVKVGKAPPPSRYPTLAKGDLVAPTSAAMGFPAIPGAPGPDDKINPMLVYDFGETFRYDDVSGVMARVPPVIAREAPSLVPRVDADGNETSGVASVQARVPLGAYLGWNVVAKGYYAGTGCGFQGGFIPFATTEAERRATGDPRPSLEKRYGTHANFVAKVRAAADEMVKEGVLLSDDAARIVREAEASDVLKAR